MLLPTYARLRHSLFRQSPMLGFALLTVCGVALGRACEKWYLTARSAGLENEVAKWANRVAGLNFQVGDLAFQSGDLVFAAAALIFLFVFLALRKRELHRRTALAGIGFVLLLAAARYLSEAGGIRTDWPEGERTWALRVTSVEKISERGKTADAELIDTTAALHGKTVRVHLSGEGAEDILPGCIVAAEGEIATPPHADYPGGFDYGDYLLVRHVSGTLYAAPGHWGVVRTDSAGDWKIRLQRFRQTLTDNYFSHLGNENAAILSALTLGDKSRLTTDTRDTFTDTGTSHILALSGLHLSIVFALLNVCFLRHLRRTPLRFVATITVLLFLWGFVLLAGAPVSLVRAACMFTMLQLGVSLHRTRNATLNHLSTAAVLILLFDPLALFDVSFQLSFVSVASIVLCQRYLWSRLLPDASAYMYDNQAMADWGNWVSYGTPPSPRRRIGRGVNGLLRRVVLPFCFVSLGAQIGTLPLTLYYFHRFTPYALAANVIVIPAAYVLLGGSGIFLLAPFEGLRRAVAQVLDFTLRTMTAGLEQISRWKGASIWLYPDVWTIVPLTAAVVLMCLYGLYTRKVEKRKILLLFTLCLGLAALNEVYRHTWGSVQRQILFYRLPRATAVHFVVSAERSYLFASLPPDSARLALAYAERNFFNAKGMVYPRQITAADWKDEYFLRRDKFFASPAGSVYLLDGNVKSERREPLAVDVLLVSRGTSQRPEEVFGCFAPRAVVLDNTLARWRCREWRKACRKEGVPCHDLRREGTFVWEE